MTDKPYTNRELARDYLSLLVMRYDLQKSQLMARKIVELNVDLPSFYQEHGRSFDELRVKGIGNKTKKTLALILEKGVEEVRRMAIEETSQRSMPGSHPIEDTYPGWEDAVRRLEGD